MTKVLKSKRFIGFVSFCLLLSLLLIVFNLSQVKRYQLNRRNSERKTEIESIVKGIENYISTNKTLPTTSNPGEKSYLPELILMNGVSPVGGVTVQSLENMQSYFDTAIKDPSGSPYLVGRFEKQILVYTTNWEVLKKGNETYFKAIEVGSDLEEIPNEG